MFHQNLLNVLNLVASKKDDKHSNRLLKNLYVSVCSSPSQSNKHLNILVADTPEAEYGMPYRLRRFRHRKKNDNCYRLHLKHRQTARLSRYDLPVHDERLWGSHL
jgi:hypothetical protein